MKFTNSSLVTYKNLSPRCNHWGERTADIIYFTPHCVVGQCDIETLGSVFANPNRRASSNYGIGRDGRIGLFVEEKNAAGTSSSYWNDNRAITVECASDLTEPYAFRGVVYDRLVTLLVDCCKRYNKNKVIWLGSLVKTKAYTPRANEMVLTVHRFYANTECPGTWMFNKMAQLAADANTKLNSPAPYNPNIKTTVFEGVDYKLVYDPDYYYNKYVDLQKAIGKDYYQLLSHFVRYGMKEGRQANATFNVWTYKGIYDDLQAVYKEDIKSYYLHYMNGGCKEGRYTNAEYFEPVFNVTYYAKKYPDIKKAFSNDPNKLLRHFIKYGMKEGRQGCSTFIVQKYKNNYKDLQQAFGDNLPKYYLHYITNGQKEHRIATKKI